MIGSVWAQVRIPGVIQGNYFTYDVIAYWTSSDENASVPADLLEINMTDFYQVSIVSVNGTEITTRTVWAFTNGTQTASMGTIDVSTGESDGGFWAIVAANLGVNDVLHPDGANDIAVNETITTEYLGGARETNRLILSLTGSDSGGNYVEHVDYNFDKVTGMLVQLNDAKIYSDPTTTITKYWKIKDTSSWLIPEFPSALILPLLMAVTMIAAIAYKKKQLGMAKTLTPS
jgi:hypothetical protein